MDFFHGNAGLARVARPDAGRSQIVYAWPDPVLLAEIEVAVAPDEAAVLSRAGRADAITPDQMTPRDEPASGRLFFVSTREFAHIPFGERIRNVARKTSARVDVRVYGEYALQVAEPPTLILELVERRKRCTNLEIMDWVRRRLLDALRAEVTARLPSDGWSPAGILAHLDEIEAATVARTEGSLRAAGLRLTRLENLSVALEAAAPDALKEFEVR